MDPNNVELTTVDLAGSGQLWMEGINRLFFGSDFGEWIATTGGDSGECNSDSNPQLNPMNRLSIL